MKRIAKRALVLLVLTMLLALIGAPAYAEETGTLQALPAVLEIVIALIGFLGAVAAAAFGWAAKKYIIPWVQTNHLEKIAGIAVNAAEALYGAGKGYDKWKWASEYLQKHGIDLDRAAIDAAIDAAWNKLNLGQITAGVKAAEPIVVVNPGARG